MSSSEKRTIKINPDLFKVSEKNTSRKRRSSSTEIKVKAPKQIRNKTLRKSVLNMLRKNIRDRESINYKNHYFCNIFNSIKFLKYQMRLLSNQIFFLIINLFLLLNL